MGLYVLPVEWCEPASLKDWQASDESLKIVEAVEKYEAEASGSSVGMIPPGRGVEGEEMAVEKLVLPKPRWETVLKAGELYPICLIDGKQP